MYVGIKICDSSNFVLLKTNWIHLKEIKKILLQRLFAYILHSLKILKKEKIEDKQVVAIE